MPVRMVRNEIVALFQKSGMFIARFLMVVLELKI